MKINRRNPLHWCYLALQAVFTLCAVALRPFLNRGRPNIIILYGHQFSGHLAAIYDYWKANDIPDLECHFLTLNPSPALTGETDVNLLYCRRFSDMLMVAKASAMITDHGLHLMFPLVSLTNIIFIDVGHGIPFKGYDEHDFRLQHRYREIWMSSKGVSRLYESKCGCRNLVDTIGSPRTDKLLSPDPPINQFREYLHIDKGAPIVLYAPTWQQDDKQRALLPFGQTPDAFLDRCSTFCKMHDCYFVFRSHQNASFPKLTYDRVFFCPQSEYPDTENILLDTNILISDWSSIVFDFLVLDRPTIFLDVPPPFAKGCTLGPEYRFGHIVGDMDSLVDALAQSIASPTSYWDQYADTHRSVKAFAYDDNADGRASERGLNRLETLLS